MGNDGLWTGEVLIAFFSLSGLCLYFLHRIIKADMAYWQHVREEEERLKIFTDEYKPVKLDEFEEHLS